MIRIKNLELRIKLFIPLFFILYSLFLPIEILALDSSPSADIKVKLEELKKEIASKAAKLKQEVNRKLKDKAYIGQVKSKSDTSITIATQSDPKMVSINQDTVFSSNIKGKQKFSLKTLLEEDYIAALGDTDETGVLTAKKIVLLQPTKLQPKTHLWGQIISISNQLVMVKNRDLKNIATILPSGTKVAVNDFVILTGSKEKNDIFDAEFVYVIPQPGILKPKKVATPSATLATPSAKPKRAIQ